MIGTRYCERDSKLVGKDMYLPLKAIPKEDTLYR